MGTDAQRAVELSVNVHERDLGFFEPTYRHQIRQLGGRPDLRRLVIDRSTPTGRFTDRAQSPEALDSVVSSLITQGLVDVVTEVDWDVAVVEDTMQQAFGDRYAPVRCSTGTPIYQYLHAVHACEMPYLLHLDSDMLLHLADGGRWIDEAIDLMRADERVIITTPEGGPAQATGARDWLLGDRQRPSESRRWHVSSGVSTRIFLMDVERFRSQALPLVPSQPGEPLEASITHTFATRGLQRQSLNDDDNWAIHPRRHNDNHRRYLTALIHLVEQGRPPFRRTGYRWDMRTEGRHFLPWWLAIQRRALSTRG